MMFLAEAIVIMEAKIIKYFTLSELSEKFKAFEWLRQEANKGNRYAYIMALEIKEYYEHVEIRRKEQQKP